MSVFSPIKKLSKKAIQRILIIVLIVVLAYPIIATIIVEAVYTSLGYRQHQNYTATADPEDYDITIVESDIYTEDDMRIHIYESIVDNPKGVVMMLSGIDGPSVTYFYGQAELVKHAGYASVLIEARGHGKSEGDVITFGISDVKDVNAAIDYVNGQTKYANIPIVMMGLSMGGATAINAGSHSEFVDGIIAISPFSSWTDACLDMVETVGAPRFIGELLRPGIIISGYLHFGEDFFKMQPKEAIKYSNNKPILIMRSKEDKIVTIKNEDRLAGSYCGDNVTTVFRDGSNHHFINGNGMHKPFGDKEYCILILTFLNQFLNNEEKINVDQIVDSICYDEQDAESVNGFYNKNIN